MAGAKPRICASIVDTNLPAIKKVETQVDLFEVRIDLIGGGWRDVSRHIKKPWIACNRRAEEGGKWRGSESRRIKELLSALDFGAAIIDIELATPGVEKVVKEIKNRTECLLSYHNIKETPSLKKMKEILKNQLDTGADIGKVVTTAHSFVDNISILQLIADSPGAKVVAFAMAAVGQISRILCLLVGGYFTYASIEEGRESAEGQMTVTELRKIYGMLKND